MTLGENLQQARKKKKLTQTDVANILGIKAATISGYESDYRSPDADTLAKLAQMYEVSLDALMNIKPPAPETYGTGDFFPAPIVGTIRCGFNSIILEDIEGTKIVDMQFLNSTKKEDYVWTRAKGDSMSGDRIDEGDFLLICRQSDVNTGSLAAVTVDDEQATVKRVIKKANMLILQPSNPKYEPMVFVGPEMNRVRIVGEVIESRKDLRRQKKVILVHETPEDYK